MVIEELRKRLRAHAPAKVRAINAHDEERMIAVPTRRKKWDAVVEAIEAVPWVRCELLDKTGAIVGYVQNDLEADGIEELTGPGAHDKSNVQGYLRLMLDAQRQALTFRDKETTELLKGVGTVLQANTEAIRGLTGLYQAQVEIAAALAHDKATLEAGGNIDQIVKLVEASPQLMMALAPMFKLLSAKAGPAK
jgi:hypothetical protein